MVPPYNSDTVEKLNEAIKTYFMKDNTFNIFVSYDSYEEFFTYYFYDHIEPLPLDKDNIF